MMDIKQVVSIIGGRNINAKEYTKPGNTVWIGWLPGIGELGAMNGSQIDKIELFNGTTPVSWTAAAKNGFDFPFNIHAIQLPVGWDYWAIKDAYATFLKETKGATKVGITGYSLGGRGTWACLQGDTKNYIDFIAPVCGYYDTTIAPIPSLRTVFGYAVHGDKDTTMDYSWDYKNIQAYNQGRPTQLINNVTQPCCYLQTIGGAGHAVWPNAYDLTPGKDNLYQWVLQQIGASNNVVITDNIVSSYYDGKQIIFVTASGKKINIDGNVIG